MTRSPLEHLPKLKRIPENVQREGRSRSRQDGEQSTKAFPGKNSQCRGPNGPPVYDKLGFELDPKLCAQSRQRPRKPTLASTNRMMAEFEKSRECKERVFKSGSAERHPYDSILRDRVARDLGMQYHEVGLPALEEWGRRGFQLEPDFFKREITEEERERASKLQLGCAFRKGYDKSW